MKKLKITGQLVSLFAIVILIAILIYSALIVSSISSSSETYTFNRLTDMVNDSKLWLEGKALSENYESKIYVLNGKVTVTKDDTNMSDDKGRDFKFVYTFYQSDEELNSISNIISLNELASMVGHPEPDNDGIKNPTTLRFRTDEYPDMFMAYQVSKPTFEDAVQSYYFVIFFSTENLAKDIRQTQILGLIVSFTAAFSISLIILLAWSRRHVSRIKKLQKHISLLPSSNYKDAYLDNGMDEIGELSMFIEKMRLEILANEKTKQEMLQNVSHDFKTPIGVIKSYAEAMEDGHMIDKGPQVIVNQANILYNKTQQLIIYNKLEYLTHDKPYEDINMKRLIESVINNATVQHPNINFICDLEPNVYFKGYADNYIIVAENIIDNASRYAKKVIRVTLKDDYLSFFNDGEPIDQKFIESGFKAYEKGSQGKFGLGMSIVCKTLDFFGYYLSVSNLDDGVLFEIRPKNETDLNIDKEM